MANIAVDHPARVATDRVTEIFGLSDEDSMVVVVVDPTSGGVFDVQTLGLIEWLTRSIQRLEGVDPEEVTSLATEKDIVGKDWGMEVMPFFDTPPATAEAAAAVRDAVLGFDLYVDGLVAANGGAAAIVVELLEGADANAVYHELLRLAADAPTWGEAVHVAGIRAFTARTGRRAEAADIEEQIAEMVASSLTLGLHAHIPLGYGRGRPLLRQRLSDRLYLTSGEISGSEPEAWATRLPSTELFR